MQIKLIFTIMTEFAVGLILEVRVLGTPKQTRVEALVCGHPRDAKKVSVTGADRLRECKNTEVVWAFSRCPYVELSAYQSVRWESFYCIAFSSHNTGRKLNEQIKTRSQWIQQHQGRETRPEEQRKSCFRPGFANKVPEKSQTTEDFTVFRPSQIQQTR